MDCPRILEDPEKIQRAVLFGHPGLKNYYDSDAWVYAFGSYYSEDFPLLRGGYRDKPLNTADATNLRNAVMTASSLQEQQSARIKMPGYGDSQDIPAFVDSLLPNTRFPVAFVPWGYANPLSHHKPDIYHAFVHSDLVKRLYPWMPLPDLRLYSGFNRIMDQIDEEDRRGCSLNLETTERDSRRFYDSVVHLRFKGAMKNLGNIFWFGPVTVIDDSGDY